MPTPSPDQELLTELKSALDSGLANGDLMTADQIAANLAAFSERFGAQNHARMDSQADRFGAVGPSRARSHDRRRKGHELGWKKGADRGC